ncbi:hypothetical protein BDV96DRAFT_355255 [Lophiotrema nucula]|uniref:DUF7820 domain-containing protein n=1 Tax=Lophiotrema nucula TaxID=690887 RepID=A0A6A5YI41_9PLEO|nr:hypothetical protein BDV96DRAFT_355255 [Lophiotrema nucula]
MDGVSTAALIGSALAAATKSVKTLKELSEKYKNANQSIQLLIARLSTLRAALAQLHAFFASEGAARVGTLQLQSDIEAAIRPCNAIIVVLGNSIEQAQSGWLSGRLRYLWDESAIKEHSIHLDSQVAALNLLLQVVQFSTVQQQRAILDRGRTRRILQRARDDASSYVARSSLRLSSTQSMVHLDFNEILLKSDVYRGATDGSHEQGSANVDIDQEQDTSMQMDHQDRGEKELAPFTDQILVRQEFPKKIQSERHWRSSRVLQCCSKPAFLLTLALAVLLIVILSAVLAFVLANHKNRVSGPTKGSKDRFTSTRASTVTLFDATPMPTPSNLPPIPAGPFALPMEASSEKSTSCLTNSSQTFAWSCNMNTTMTLIINGTKESQTMSLDPGARPDGILEYGAQPPVWKDIILQLVTDLDSPMNGPAFLATTQYDKMVILQREELASNSTSENKRQIDGSRSSVLPGDSPWFCHWNLTYVEAFIYVQQNSSAATRTGSLVSTAATAFSAPTQTSNSSPRLPEYPRVVKVEERRLPGAPLPYCQLMSVLDNMQVMAAKDVSGGVIMVQLQEQDPDLDKFAQENGLSRRLTTSAEQKKEEWKKRKEPAGACHCQWIFS